MTQAARPSFGMVVAAQKEAAEAGAQILRQGGNAFDAAAATALALGVVEPGSSGIGGGGFFLLYIAKEKRYVMLDARETAPKLAGHGEVFQTNSSIDGPQSAGVPGLVAGVDRLATTYGRLGRKTITGPAIRLARGGFKVSPRLSRMIAWRGKVFNDTAKRTFLKKEGEIIRQSALADTLARFAARGATDFYRGETAGRLAADMKHDGGLIRISDLAGYQAIERDPVQFDWQGFHIVSASLPSSGGMTLAEIFGMLKHDKLKTLSIADRDHLLIEAMKRAYRDRNQHLGDADFVAIPKDYLDSNRLKKLRDSIRMDRATPSSELGHIAEPSGNAANTTHFSIIDKEGNMVAATLSINYGFGSGYVSPSTGILLNDEMDDFATRPGKPNAYGLVQGKANAVAPGKRMLSSMTPTFVIGPKRTLIVGTPGGSRIISMVLLASIRFMLNETPPADWVNAPRFHHQFLPDVVQYEQGAFTPEVTAELTKRGHHLKQIRNYGNMQAILWNRKTGVLTGSSDARGEGGLEKTQALKFTTPYVRKNTCPFEGCSYGRWLIVKRATVFSSPDKHSSVVGVLRPEGKVKVVTGELHIVPGKAMMFGEPHKSASHLDSRKEILILDYIGEGYSRVFQDGKFSSVKISRSMLQCKEKPDWRYCWAKVLRKPISKWWVFVRTLDGRLKGWVLMEGGPLKPIDRFSLLIRPSDALHLKKPRSAWSSLKG